MKKFILTAVMTIIALTVSSQVNEGFRMGIRINGGLSNVVADGTEMRFGYGVGWIAEYNFSPNLFLQSGIGLENVAHKQEAIDGTLNAYYAQLPIHIGYRFGMSESSCLFIQAGPTIGIGLFGSKVEWRRGGETNYFDSAKRFDLSAGGRIGVEFSQFQISAGANYGVLKTFDGGGHNLSINLGLAYMF